MGVSSRLRLVVVLIVLASAWAFAVSGAQISNDTDSNLTAINETLTNITIATEQNNDTQTNETISDNDTLIIEVIESNETVLNGTIQVNEITSKNITEPAENITVVEDQSENVESIETIIDGQVVIGKPVKTIKRIKLKKPTANFSVKIPRYSENVTVYKINGNIKTEISYEKIKINSSGTEIPIEETNLITGQIVAGGDDKGFLTNLFRKIFSIIKAIFRTSAITGFAVFEEESNTTKIIIQELVKEFEVNYYTEAPKILEVEISANKKEVTVYSNLNYENVLTFTNITESKKESIRIYKLSGEVKELVESVNYTDYNNNSLIDKISWIIPSLPSESYEIEIIEVDASVQKVPVENTTVINETNEVTTPQNFVCKEFKEQVIWSSGYSFLSNGSTNYQTWYPKNSCEELNASSCIIRDIALQTRFISSDSPETKIIGEGYIQISEPDESICNNPSQGSYFRYLAYETTREEEKKMTYNCKKNKDCEEEKANSLEYKNCYGIKLYGDQYLIVDAFYVNYNLCVNTGGEQ